MTLDQIVATVIRIDDDALPNGRCHSLCVTMWTLEQGSTDEQQRVASFLAIDFLERTLAAMKLEVPVTDTTYWRTHYAEAKVHVDDDKGSQDSSRLN